MGRKIASVRALEILDSRGNPIGMRKSGLGPTGKKTPDPLAFSYAGQ